ncbi:MAG: hypothetical protein DRJ03_11115 [Chloroflexi bacterium]|nr:MAG: hypothetical protein DRJ03_11115 [Chloroflexota bacterium]
MQELCFVKDETVTAGTSGKISLGKLPIGYVYRVKRVEVHIQSGAAGNLEIALYVGDTKIIPDTGFFTSDLAKNISMAQKDLPEGAELFIWRNNKDAANNWRYAIIVDLQEII